MRAIHLYPNGEPASDKMPSALNMLGAGFSAPQVAALQAANAARVRPPVKEKPKPQPDNPPRDNNRLTRKRDPDNGDTSIQVFGYET
jgi:hypothetical protein